MELFEAQTLETAPLKPSLYKHYVDDMLLVWTHWLEKLHIFVSHPNFFFNAIQFTTELEAEGKLSFWDIDIRRHANDTVGRAVFRKKTHTQTFI